MTHNRRRHDNPKSKVAGIAAAAVVKPASPKADLGRPLLYIEKKKKQEKDKGEK